MASEVAGLGAPVRSSGVPSEAWIRSASFQQIWAEVIDPWVLAILQRETFAGLDEARRDLTRAWLLHGVACRSGLGSLVAEEPVWLADEMGASLRRLGLLRLAALWEEATRGMDFAAWHGKMPAEVRFTAPAALAALQEALVRAEFGDLPELIVERVRANAGRFASA